MTHTRHATLLLLLLAGCAGRTPRGSDATQPGVVSSNVLRRDYAGSAACEGCHAEVYRAWSTSPMRRMTRTPNTDELAAPFDGRTWSYRKDNVRLSQDGGDLFMSVRSPAFGDHVYRVTRVIGGRYREDFAGVEVASPTLRAPVVGDASRELVLPASYVYETGTFRLKGYSVMVGERPGLRAGGVWNQTCLFCHNTVPLFDTLWGAMHGPGAPGYQGQTVDRLLPADKRVEIEVLDRRGLERALADEMEAIGGDARGVRSKSGTDALAAAIHGARTRFGGDHVVELGIGCEACHGGSAEHVARPSVRPSFEPQSPLFRVKPAAGKAAVSRAEWQNRACARCHDVLFSRYPYTWEGGERAHHAGGSSMNSGEARDYLLGGCARAMTCTTCHDPHGADKREALLELATPAGNRVCFACHRELSDVNVLRAHAHHDPKGAGGACVACHMPRKNMGLGYDLTRYHRIGSPTARERVEGDRPLECALCHADRSTGSLVETMERWWGKKYDRAALVRAYGDLDRPNLLATIERGKPHEVATAIAAAGDARFDAAAPAITQSLLHAYPLVRHWARAALGRMPGRRCAVDLDRDDASVFAAARKCEPSVVAPVGPRGAPAAHDDDD